RRDAGAHGPHPLDEEDVLADDPPHRAPDGPRDGPLRAPPGPGLRRHDRRGEARGDPREPEGPRVLPRAGERGVVTTATTAGAPLLEARDLVVCYGGIRAVKGISFHVDEGEIVALVGANGAGKSSTLRALSGLVPWQGEVLHKGESLRGMAAHRIVA